MNKSINLIIKTTQIEVKRTKKFSARTGSIPRGTRTFITGTRAEVVAGATSWSCKFQYADLVKTGKEECNWSSKQSVCEKSFPPRRHEFIYIICDIKHKTKTEAKKDAFNK
jgi:hypothetical protein